MRLKELIYKDVFLDKMKDEKIQRGDKIQFFGSTSTKLDFWKTYYFVKFADIGGKKESGAILSLNKNLSTVDKYGRYTGYYYSYYKIRKGGGSGARPNTYNLQDIMDIKIG